MDLVEFGVVNLFECSDLLLVVLGCFDKMLIDFLCEGVYELVKVIGEKNGLWCIVYVLCNLLILVWDVVVLIDVKGYWFVLVGVVNMFL